MRQFVADPTSWIDALHTDDRDRVLASLTQQSQDERVHREYRIVQPNGSVRWIAAHVTPLCDETGKPLRYIGLAEDITDRKQAELTLQQLTQALEEQVQERTTQLQLALSAVRMGIWEWDITTGIQYWSKEHYELFGFGTNNQKHVLDETGMVVSPKPTQDLFIQCVHPDDRERLLKNEQQAWEEQTLSDKEYRVVLRDGTTRWIYSRGTFIYNAKGQPIKMLGIAVDITDRKQVEEQLLTSLQEKELLLREVHHRVKNNLQVISSLLSLQSSTITDPKILAPFQENQNRIQVMGLIHERLYHSKNLARLNFAKYVEDLAIELFQSYIPQGAAITLQVKVANVVLGVDTAIPCGLIINELVSNAVKYAFPGDRSGRISILFEAANQNSLQQGPASNTANNSNNFKQYVLTVMDNGIGFPKDLNFRETESLGLQVVCALTTQLGGTIELDCTRGTIFTVIFSV